MSDLTETRRALTEQLEAAQKDAQARWQAFEEARRKAAELGPQLLEDEQAYEELAAASKAYDEVCDQVNALQAKLNKLAEVDGKRTPPITIGGVEAPADEPATPADRFLASPAWQFVKERLAGGAGVAIGSSPAVEAVTRAELKATLGSASYPKVSFRREGIVELPTVQPDLLDLVPVVEVDTDVVEIVRETTYSPAAAETAEADTTGAPEASLAYSVVSVPVRWVAHYLPATKQLLADEARLRDFIDRRLVLGVRQRLQQQVLSGDGSGQNLTGILNTSGIGEQAKGTDTLLDAIRKAKTVVIAQSAGAIVPNVLLINEADLEEIELAKGSDGHYVFGGPGGGPGTIWGLRPVVHHAVPEGSPIVCDISQAEVYVRQGVTVSVTDSHADFFRRGMVAILAEGRFGFAVVQPKAFCVVTSI